MEGVQISRLPKLKNPYLIVAWPGMGEVAFKAANYLIEKLKAVEFAQILPEDFFYLTASVVQRGVLSAPQLPYSKFYYWHNKMGSNDLVIFISSAQPDLVKAQVYCSRIIELAKALKVKKIISFAAMPQPVDHTQQPNVWFASTCTELNNSLKKYNLNLLSEGQISGMNGLFLGLAKKEGFSGFCLLGEIPLYTIQIENPKAACAVLTVLSKILNIHLDFNGLLAQVQSMEEEMNKLLDYLKIDSHAVNPIGEEEIERIRKTLNQLTRLPGSVKEKIEQLFAQARIDISKAGELKTELDRWNVYKEYEDRFLDLFRKSKDN